MNSAAAHSYRAVPFILTVVPSGITNPETFADTPASDCSRCKETGKVAAELLVENALFFGVVVAALLIQMLVWLPLILRSFGLSPLRHFKAVGPALLTAFSTSSYKPGR